MHKSQSLFNLITALHVSGIAITHLQEHKTTVTTASGNRYTVLLSAAIVEELELMCVVGGVDQHATYNTLISSNSSTIAADNSTAQRLPDAVVTVVL